MVSCAGGNANRAAWMAEPETPLDPDPAAAGLAAVAEIEEAADAVETVEDVEEQRLAA